MKARLTAALVDQQISRLLKAMTESGLPVQAVLAGAWSAVNGAMIRQFGADATAGEHEAMAAAIRGHLHIAGASDCVAAGSKKDPST
jgi:hypothetical protein